MGYSIVRIGAIHTITDQLLMIFKDIKEWDVIYLQNRSEIRSMYCTGWGGGGDLVAKSCPILAAPWTMAHQAPLSMGFSRQEYWSGLPFPSPGNFPDPGIEPRSPALQADSLPTELQGKPCIGGRFHKTVPKVRE